jgi:hypothetical protein
VGEGIEGEVRKGGLGEMGLDRKAEGGGEEEDMHPASVG